MPLTDKAKADLVRRCEMLMRFESMSEGIDSPARVLRDLIRLMPSEPFAPDAVKSASDFDRGNAAERTPR